MDAVDDYKKKLDGVISDLDSVIEQIIKKQQDSFISAYSHYLQDVKVQLRTLQEDYSVEVYRTKNDEKITALHKSLDWFKDESLRLTKDIHKRDKVIMDFKQEVME
jgi:hypothetical protein